LFALGDGKRPVKEIAHVGENLPGGARFVADMEAGEVVGGASKGFAATVGDGGYGVTEELAGKIGWLGHIGSPEASLPDGGGQ